MGHILAVAVVASGNLVAHPIMQVICKLLVCVVHNLYTIFARPGWLLRGLVGMLTIDRYRPMLRHFQVYVVDGNHILIVLSDLRRVCVSIICCFANIDCNGLFLGLRWLVDIKDIMFLCHCTRIVSALPLLPLSRTTLNLLRNTSILRLRVRLDSDCHTLCCYPLR